MPGAIHVVGTGTIGEPLIGTLCNFRKIGILDPETQITFTKETPVSRDRPKVKLLQARGAKFAAGREKWDAFKEAGMNPDLSRGQALIDADVVIDCTPHGNKLKQEFYLDRVDDTKLFVAQGSETGFGPRYAGWINDLPIFNRIYTDHEKFIQVVSCNTHAITAIVNSIGLWNGTGDPENVVEVRAMVNRRSNDISQTKKYVPAPQVGGHDDVVYGTHQGRDAALLFRESFGYVFPIFRTSVFKLNTQYMHSTWFEIRVQKSVSRDDVIDILKANPLIALTEKDITNEVLSAGRDHGPFGRIFNHIVVPIHKPSEEKAFPLTIFPNPDGTTSVIGFSFTPQDGNSLLSSSKIVLIALYPDEYEERANRILTSEDPLFVFKEL